MASYGNNYVAFLDILGFKNIIDSGDWDADRIDKLFDDIGKINLQSAIGFQNDNLNIPLPDVEKYVMSDSIVMYIDANKRNSLQALIKQCSLLTVKMLSMEEPVLLRGGIAKGDFYGNQSRAFGPALTKAYLLQEYSAVYPRIIMLNDILCDEAGKEKIDSITYIDDDMFCCVEFLGYMADENIQKLKKYIRYILDRTSDIKIRSKYLYLEKLLKENGL